jgi:hypothetical protein
MGEAARRRRLGEARKPAETRGKSLPRHRGSAIEAWQRLVDEAVTDGVPAVCDIEIVSLDRWPDLLLDDDPSAARVVALILDFFRQAIAPGAPVATCLTCDGPGLPPGAIAVVMAHRDDATVGVVSGICEGCARRHAAPGALMAAATAAWKRWFPDLRKIDISDQSGHA